MRSCLHIKCKKSVTDDLMACRPHWMQLPADIRKGLMRAKSNIKREKNKVVEVPENVPLMKAVAGQAHQYWADLDKPSVPEKKNAAT